MGILLLLAGLVYAGDFLWLRYRIPRSRDAFGTVMVRSVYVIHEKNGKTQYQFTPPGPQQCVRSLFPHLGYSPCWYVSRHTENRIEI